MRRGVLTFQTQDEAIAEALRGASDGEIIEIHAAECKGVEEPYPPHDVVGCTCEPMTFVVGAKA